MSKSSSLPPLTPPPRGRSTPPDASDPDSTPRGDEKGRRLREKNTKRLPASASAPLLKADESPSRRSSSESAGVIASGGAGASAAVGASAELERARLLHALGVDLLAASLPEAAHGFMQRALRSAPRREAQLIGMSTCRSAYRGTTCAHSATSRRLMHTWLGLGLGLAVRVRASG